MDLSREILNAETLFLTKLEEFFLCFYPGDKMTSHDLNHHRRVWAYAKEFLCYPGTDPIAGIDLLPGKLIIAAYLHDIGMSIDPGPKHGLHSRIFCENFLISHNLEPVAFSDLLDAVENHDDKEYTTNHNNRILRILSVADDLDALGNTGIYRYIEIYLMRKVEFEELGDLIISNVRTRFTNMERYCGEKPGFLKRHYPRYEIIVSFFEKYNKQKISYNFGTKTPSGCCGIAELIDRSVRQGISLEKLFTDATGPHSDKIVKQYFLNLRNELIR